MPTETVRVREATPDDLVATMNVLDGAGLAVDADRVRERLAAGDVLVAVAGADTDAEPDPDAGADPDVDARADTGATAGAGAGANAGADADPDVDGGADERVVGALVADPAGPPWTVDRSAESEGTAPATDPSHVVAVAVRRRRRDRGVGTALVEAAAARAGRLTAAFPADVGPFYESLGFAVTGETPDGRLRGVRDGA